MSLRFDATSGIGTLESTPEAGSDRFRFRCPECGSKAFSPEAICSVPRRAAPRRERRSAAAHAAESIAAKAPFLDAYRRVRRIEGGRRRRLLPRPSLRVRRPPPRLWKIRARSYRGALRAIARRFPEVKRADEWDKLALRILEVGAGNGWFSWRMAQAGTTSSRRHLSRRGRWSRRRFAIRSAGVAHGDRLTRALAEMEDLPSRMRSSIWWWRTARSITPGGSGTRSEKPTVSFDRRTLPRPRQSRL
jgi:hypothetical protein